MADTFEFTLDEESEKKLFEIMTEVNTEKTPSFTITDKYGNTSEYVKIVRCRECKWYEFDKLHYCGFGGHGYRLGYDFCSDAERKDNV